MTSTTLKEASGGVSDGTPVKDPPAPEGDAAPPELRRLEVGTSKGKTDYLVFSLARTNEPGDGVYEIWDLLCVIACSNAEQAIRKANEEYGVGVYAAVGAAKWHRREMEKKIEERLRFV